MAARFASILCILAPLGVLGATFSGARGTLPIVVANDNRAPAGTMRGDTLMLALEVREGRWYPQSDSGPFVDAGFEHQIGTGLQLREIFDSLADAALECFLQRQTDAILGRPGARVLLGAIIVN